MRIAEGHVTEGGTASYDFVFEVDEDESQNGALGPDALFIVFMDTTSDMGDLLIKPYCTDPYEDMFLCVQLDQEAVDICRSRDFSPTRFLLNVPASQVVKSKFEVMSQEKKSKVVWSGV